MLAVCARRARDLVLIAGLSLIAATAPAADNSALTVTTDLHALIAEMTLVMADQEPDLHADKASTALDRLRVSVPAALTAFGPKDPGQLAELNDQWQDLLSAFEGAPFAAAFRENSYDTNLTARYTSGTGSVLTALAPAAAAQAAKSPAAQVRLRAMRTLSSYLQMSTGIVGGTSFSANEDNDIPAGVAAVDKGLAALKQQYAGKPEAATLQRAISRWQFLRPTLLKSSGQSTPYIVYTHGQAVVQALAQLEGR